ncbi:MAG: SIS domain-containing protein, partial [Akkermansiaceae bacterium]|nr:SIS domain-containing protein [Akkermansiaceae bacterium]
ITLAQRVMQARDMLYIGRGTSFAIAHEAALKMKEISYIHAEAYAAGEMKHGGPIQHATNSEVALIAACLRLFPWQR